MTFWGVLAKTICPFSDFNLGHYTDVISALKHCYRFQFQTRDAGVTESKVTFGICTEDLEHVDQYQTKRPNHTSRLHTPPVTHR